MDGISSLKIFSFTKTILWVYCKSPSTLIFSAKYSWSRSSMRDLYCSIFGFEECLWSIISIDIWWRRRGNTITSSAIRISSRSILKRPRRERNNLRIVRKSITFISIFMITSSAHFIKKWTFTPLKISNQPFHLKYSRHLYLNLS